MRTKQEFEKEILNNISGCVLDMDVEVAIDTRDTLVRIADSLERMTQLAEMWMATSSKQT